MPSFPNTQPSALVLASAFTVTSAAYYVYRYLTAESAHLPPGPKRAPFIGNMLQMAEAKHPEVLYTELAKEHGPILYLQVFSQPMIVLTDVDVVRDLMEKRSSIYSDRPNFVLFNELMGWSMASTHVHYGPRFRKHRRFVQQVFNQKASQVFVPLQQEEALKMIEGLIQSPTSWADHFRRFAAATILKITYGHKVESVDDQFVILAERAGTLTIEAGTPAATLVDFFPILRYIPSWAPFAGFKRKAKLTKDAVENMMNIPFEKVKSDMRSGIPISSSFTSNLLEASEDEEEIKGAAGTLYVAAEDTTVCVMKSFLLAMVRNPHVFKKAQEEVDLIVGSDRLPNLDDKSSMPYLESVLKECLRWNPPAPLGLPHRLMADDYYEGHLLPAGSMVFANIYGMMFGSCDDPLEFRPERHLELNNTIPDPREIIFGFGRRICPGRHLAENSVWLTMATILATLNVSRSKDDLENGTFPPFEVNPGFIRHPKPFACSITPRSEKTMALVQDTKAHLTAY